MGKRPGPWPEPGELPCPPGFPPAAFGDAVSAWACLQLFGTLMHLNRRVFVLCALRVEPPSRRTAFESNRLRVEPIHPFAPPGTCAYFSYLF